MQYDYQCKACNHVFERVLKMADRKVPEAEPCPECGETQVKQTILACPTVNYSIKTAGVKTTDSFNDRMKDIKKALPPKYRDNINNIIR